MVTRKQARGFTLVEILIVVIILGILAAIVIPQFTNASQDARESSLSSQLQTLRSQIELYKLQHGDELPDLLNGWSDLTTATTFNGRVFGPYLQTPPTNPVNQFANVVNGTGDAPASSVAGFVYDYGTNGDGTGRIWATGKDGLEIFPN